MTARAMAHSLLLREWARQDARVRYLSLSRNFGHQAAITAGLEHAAGDVIITMDSDLQHPPQLLPSSARTLEGRPRHRADHSRRGPDAGSVQAFEFARVLQVMRWFSETETRPAAADFRLMTRKAVDSLLRLRESHRFLRGMVQWLGFRTAEVPYQPAKRVAGVSKFSVRRMLAFASDAIFSFSGSPLRLSAFLGVGLLLGGLGIVPAVAPARSPGCNGGRARAR